MKLEEKGWVQGKLERRGGGDDLMHFIPKE